MIFVLTGFSTLSHPSHVVLKVSSCSHCGSCSLPFGGFSVRESWLGMGWLHDIPLHLLSKCFGHNAFPKCAHFSKCIIQIQPGWLFLHVLCGYFNALNCLGHCIALMSILHARFDVHNMHIKNDTLISIVTKMNKGLMWHMSALCWFVHLLYTSVGGVMWNSTSRGRNTRSCSPRCNYLTYFKTRFNL